MIIHSVLNNMWRLSHNKAASAKMAAQALQHTLIFYVIRFFLNFSSL